MEEAWRLLIKMIIDIKMQTERERVAKILAVDICNGVQKPCNKADCEKCWLEFLTPKEGDKIAKANSR